MNTSEMTGVLFEVGTRIRALREIAGYSVVYMAEQTGLDVETYIKYESGTVDLPFTFIHNCAKIFNVDITDIMSELPEVGTDEESTGGEYDIYVEIVGQYVSLTMETALNVDVTVQWSTDSHSGTVVIPRGTLDAEFDAGGQIHDEREIGFAASTPEGDTFNFIFS